MFQFVSDSYFTLIGQLFNTIISFLPECIKSWFFLALFPILLLSDFPRFLVQSSVLKMEKLKKLLKINAGKVSVGDKGDELYQIPVYQRSDGLTIRLGSYANLINNEEESSTFNVKNILVTADLEEVFAVLVPSDCISSLNVKSKDVGKEPIIEEMTVQINEIVHVRNTGVCTEVARNGMEAVAASVKSCPFQVQKFIRKHQIASFMRKEVQRFLSGFSMAGTCSLGCIDWKLDPLILGLERETDFSMEYRVEKSVDNVTHMDLLMGNLWDVRSISGSDGYRIILTLELLVDSNQELFLKMHATLLAGKLDRDHYRSVCLRDTSNLHMIYNRRLSDITNNRTRRLSDVTNNASGAVVTPGQTLAWDEFATQSAGNSPFHVNGATPCITVSIDDMFTNGTNGSAAAGNLPTFPTSSTNTFQTLEKLLSALPQSQIVFNSPIKEVSGEYTGVSSNLTGPNTSTPADDLDDKDHVTSTTPDSSPSLHDHKPDQKHGDVSVDEEIECLNLKENNAVSYNIQEEELRELSPEVDMNVGPDEATEELDDNALNDCKTDELDDNNDVMDENGDSARPSPNISVSTGVEDSSPSKPLNGAMGNTQNQLHNLNTMIMSPLVSKTSSPPRMSSLKRVQDYIQSLPSPQHFTRRSSGSLGGEGSITSPLKSIKSPLHKSTNSPLEEDNTSQCSGSVLSRQSDLSSLTGARMASGIFYGSSSINGAANAPVCPYPEDWQQTIPESIENDDEID